MKQLDLGCGSAPAFNTHGREGYDVFGIDINDFDNPKIKIADLAIDPIPFEDDEFELVTAYDFLEHIPKVLYLADFSDPLNPYHYKWNCMIELFNEVYRVLKNDGRFYFEVPEASSAGYLGDPTHVYPWTIDAINYLSGDYFGFHQDLQHTSKFKKIMARVDGGRLFVELVAIKPNEPPYEL